MSLYLPNSQKYYREHDLSALNGTVATALAVSDK